MRAEEEITRIHIRPRVARFFFYFSSMDYFPPLLHLRLNHLNNLKSNVPRDPSAKIRYTAGNPGRYSKYLATRCACL